MPHAYDLNGKRIWVAGHRGMVGAAVVRRLARIECTVLKATRAEVDLEDQRAVRAWMARHRPDVIVMAAARVGGIAANAAFPVDFLHRNLTIAANVSEAAHASAVERMLFLGSSCIYPRLAPQPIPEDALLSGPLEPTNEWYAIAKIAGIKLMQAYRQQYGRDWISAMPTNLYGPGDNYDLESSHVLPALVRKFHEARAAGAARVPVWGSGAPLREFLHCDDLADALVFVLQTYSHADHINVGSGVEISIRDLAHTVARVVGFDGEIVFDPSRPDGTPRKLMDNRRLKALGWDGARPLETGIRDTYASYLRARETAEVRR